MPRVLPPSSRLQLLFPSVALLLLLLLTTPTAAQTITCGDDCNDRTLSSVDAGGTSEQPVTFVCQGYQSCLRSSFVCAANHQCTLECQSPMSCLAASLSCVAEGSRCSVRCLSRACLALELIAPTPPTPTPTPTPTFELQCLGDWACTMMGDYSPGCNATSCSRTCDSACQETTEEVLAPVGAPKLAFFNRLQMLVLANIEPGDFHITNLQISSTGVNVLFKQVPEDLALDGLFATFFDYLTSAAFNDSLTVANITRTSDYSVYVEADVHPIVLSYGNSVLELFDNFVVTNSTFYVGTDDELLIYEIAFFLEGGELLHPLLGGKAFSLADVIPFAFTYVPLIMNAMTGIPEKYVLQYGYELLDAEHAILRVSLPNPAQCQPPEPLYGSVCFEGAWQSTCDNVAGCAILFPERLTSTSQFVHDGEFSVEGTSVTLGSSGLNVRGKVDVKAGSTLAVQRSKLVVNGELAASSASELNTDDSDVTTQKLTVKATMATLKSTKLTSTEIAASDHADVQFANSKATITGKIDVGTGSRFISANSTLNVEGDLDTDATSILGVDELSEVHVQGCAHLAGVLELDGFELQTFEGDGVVLLTTNSSCTLEETGEFLSVVDENGTELAVVTVYDNGVVRVQREGSSASASSSASRSQMPWRWSSGAVVVVSMAAVWLRR